jgi:cellulase/cellobiase CelA1
MKKEKVFFEMMKIAIHEFDFNKVQSTMKQLNWKWNDIEVNQVMLVDQIDRIMANHIKPAYMENKECQVESGGIRIELNNIKSDSKEVQDYFDLHILFIAERAVSNENEAIRNLTKLE